MRNANAQRANSMIPVRTLHQARAPHVSHAGIAMQMINQEGQRCALLTTKSRNTWTRATVFNSSG